MMSFEVPVARGGLPGYIGIANKIAWKEQQAVNKLQVLLAYTVGAGFDSVQHQYESKHPS